MGNKTDYLLHAIAGIFIFYLFGLPLTIIVAAAKEGFDWWRHGKIDVWDFVATIFLPIILNLI